MEDLYHQSTCLLVLLLRLEESPLVPLHRLLNCLSEFPLKNEAYLGFLLFLVTQIPSHGSDMGERGAFINSNQVINVDLFQVINQLVDVAADISQPLHILGIMQYHYGIEKYKY